MRRRYSSRGTSWKRIAIITCVSLAGGSVIALIGLYFWGISYLSSDEFRHRIEEQAARGLKAEKVQIAPLNWGGSSVGTDSFVVYNAGMMTKLEITRLDAVVDRAALLNRHFRISRISADTVSVELERQQRANSVPSPNSQVASSSQAGVVMAEDVVPKNENWFKRHILPIKYSVDEAKVRDLNFSYQDGERRYALSHVEANAISEPGNNEYKITLAQGNFSLPFPVLASGSLDRAVVRYRPDRISVSECQIKPEGSGIIDAEGEWNQIEESWDASAVLRDMDCAEVMKEDWLKKLSGTLHATVRARGNASLGLQELSGSAKIDKAVLTSLPILSKLNVFTQTKKFTQIEFDQCSSNFRSDGKSWNLSDIVLSSNSLGRVEGSVRIDADKRLSGRLHVGLLPGILTMLPGVKQVFTTEKDGYLWANMNLSGTLDHPQEDLSIRLVKASVSPENVIEAGKSLFEKMLNGSPKPEDDKKQNPDSQPDLKEKQEQSPGKGLLNTLLNSFGVARKLCLFHAVCSMKRSPESYPSLFIVTKCQIVSRFAQTAFYASLPNGKRTVAFVELKNAHLRDMLQPGDWVQVTICPADFERARIDALIPSANPDAC